MKEVLTIVPERAAVVAIFWSVGVDCGSVVVSVEVYGAKESEDGC